MWLDLFQIENILMCHKLHLILLPNGITPIACSKLMVLLSLLTQIQQLYTIFIFINFNNLFIRGSAWNTSKIKVFWWILSVFDTVLIFINFDMQIVKSLIKQGKTRYQKFLKICDKNICYILYFYISNREYISVEIK